LGNKLNLSRNIKGDIEKNQTTLCVGQGLAVILVNPGLHTPNVRGYNELLLNLLLNRNWNALIYPQSARCTPLPFYFEDLWLR